MSPPEQERTALDGWWNLVPDLGSTFITSPRGKPRPEMPNGAQRYNATNPPKDYLTGSVTPDGTLGLLYTPVARTITIDGSKMVSHYTPSGSTRTTARSPSPRRQRPPTRRPSAATPTATATGIWRSRPTPDLHRPR